jgi:hypothetical protein
VAASARENGVKQAGGRDVWWQRFSSRSQMAYFQQDEAAPVLDHRFSQLRFAGVSRRKLERPIQIFYALDSDIAAPLGSVSHYP